MKLTVNILALSTINIVINIVLQWYVISKVGIGIETDAFLAGMTIPQLIIAVTSGTLLQVLVPIFICKDIESRRLNTWSILTIVAGFFSGLSFLLCLSGSYWIPLLVPGFDDVGKLLAIELARIQLIGMIFAVINSVQIAACHSRQKFEVVEITSILANVLAIIILIWVIPDFGIISAAWILTLRVIMITFLLSPNLDKPIMPNLSTPAVILTWQRIKPLLIGTSYGMTDQLVDRHLLSSKSNGNLTLYILGQQIYGVASEVIQKTIANPLVILLKNLYDNKDYEEFMRIYHKRLREVICISLLGFLTFWFIGKNIFSLLEEYGNLSFYNIELLWLIMLLMAGRFVIGNIGIVITSMFYSLGDTKTIAQIGIKAYTVGMGIRIVMFYFYGVHGLALGITFQYIIYLILITIKSKEMKFI